MEQLDIICRNKKEIRYAEKYFLDKGCLWNKDEIYTIKFPLSIFNGGIENNTIYIGYWTSPNDKYRRVVEAKYLIRQEKLNRINNER